jgi:hypothetical protein
MCKSVCRNQKYQSLPTGSVQIPVESSISSAMEMSVAPVFIYPQMYPSLQGQMPFAPVDPRVNQVQADEAFARKLHVELNQQSV